MGLIKALLIFFCLLFPFNFAYAENTIDVTFVSCCSSEGFFWPKVESFMNAAAEDLDIDLEVIHANMNHIRMKEIAIEVAHRENPPDYLIIDNYKLIAGTILKAIDDTGIKVFLMANGLTSKQSAIHGRPREIYQNWIGELTPDNHLVGFRTANHLIEEAAKHDHLLHNDTLNLIVLSGDDQTPAGLQRIDGLLEAVANYPDIVLQQIIPCHWRHRRCNVRR